jgi:hypothetical protein
MVATIVKSTLLGLILGAALAFAAQPSPGDARIETAGAAKPGTATPPRTAISPPLPIASR